MSSAKDLCRENHLCFPLYAASRLTTKSYAPFLKELDLTYPQYLVMLVLWEHGEKKVNDISQLLYLETNTVAPLLKRLVQKGLIERTRSKVDERSVVVQLTKEGQSLQSAARDIPQKIVESFKNENLDDQDVVKFQKTLVEMVAVLHERVRE